MSSKNDRYAVGQATKTLPSRQVAPRFRKITRVRVSLYSTSIARFDLQTPNSLDCSCKCDTDRYIIPIRTVTRIKSFRRLYKTVEMPIPHVTTTNSRKNEEIVEYAKLAMQYLEEIEEFLYNEYSISHPDAIKLADNVATLDIKYQLLNFELFPKEDHPDRVKFLVPALLAQRCLLQVSIFFEKLTGSIYEDIVDDLLEKYVFDTDKLIDLKKSPSREEVSILLEMILDELAMVSWDSKEMGRNQTSALELSLTEPEKIHSDGTVKITNPPGYWGPRTVTLSPPKISKNTCTKWCEEAVQDIVNTIEHMVKQFLATKCPTPGTQIVFEALSRDKLVRICSEYILGLLGSVAFDINLECARDLATDLIESEDASFDVKVRKGRRAHRSRSVRSNKHWDRRLLMDYQSLINEIQEIRNSINETVSWATPRCVLELKLSASK